MGYTAVTINPEDSSWWWMLSTQSSKSEDPGFLISATLRGPEPESRLRLYQRRLDGHYSHYGQSVWGLGSSIYSLASHFQSLSGSALIFLTRNGNHATSIGLFRFEFT